MPTESPKIVNWLFFNPANAKSKVHSLILPDDPYDACVDNLGWRSKIEWRFRFSPDPMTLEFRRPNPHLPMDSVGEDWIRNVEDIKTITVACQPAFRVRRLFDESWDPDNVHFIVMAEAYA